MASEDATSDWSVSPNGDDSESDESAENEVFVGNGVLNQWAQGRNGITRNSRRSNNHVSQNLLPACVGPQF